MSGIVCPIRGGPTSQSTIREAIRLAKEHGSPLHFVYVVNLDFLSFTSHTRIHTITEEMRELGEFILLTAQTQADAQGVSAVGDVLEGNVLEQIIKFSHEIQANYVVLGRPKIDTHESVFTHESLNQFKSRIETETGAKVVFAAE